MQGLVGGLVGAAAVGLLWLIAGGSPAVPAGVGSEDKVARSIDSLALRVEELTETLATARVADPAPIVPAAQPSVVERAVVPAVLDAGSLVGELRALRGDLQRLQQVQSQPKRQLARLRTPMRVGAVRAFRERYRQDTDSATQELIMLGYTDVLARFGNPTSITTSNDNSAMLTWRYRLDEKLYVYVYFHDGLVTRVRCSS